jgi:hypothetical protein
MVGLLSGVGGGFFHRLRMKDVVRWISCFVGVDLSPDLGIINVEESEPVSWD